MKMMCAILVAFMAPAAATDSPLSKAIELIGNLQAKVTKASENAKANFAEHQEFCTAETKQLNFQIKTAKSDIDTLAATLEEAQGDATAHSSKIDELVASVGAAEKDLAAATAVREKEASDFAAAEKEGLEVIDTIGRAIQVLERELSKGATAMVQVKNVGSLIQAFAALEQASELSSADASKLTALVQSSQQEQDDDSDLGAPAAAVYESHSGNIIETLEGLLEKRKDSLQQERRDEAKRKANYELLKQSLSDEIKYSNKDMAASKKGLAASKETQSSTSGELAATNADLAADQASLATLGKTCAQEAQDHEAEETDRQEQLTALAEAKKILAETTGGASNKVYAAASLIQRSSVSARTERVTYDVLKLLRTLAREHQHAPALAQLASRAASYLHSSSAEGASDVFQKVKGLINDLISKLEAEATQDATEDSWCNKNTEQSSTKHDELSSTLEDLTTKIDQMSAKSSQLKEEQKTLQKELSSLASAQAKEDEMRTEQKATFDQEKKDLDDGIAGLKQALEVLRQKFTEKTSAGGGIIAALEVCESDFTKDQATIVSTEEGRAAAYVTLTKQNALDKVQKEQDLKYKAKESASIEKTVSELSQDQKGTQEELDAVNQFIEKLKERCVPKAETYEQKQAAREAEIEGLRQALSILESETSLLQTTHSLRGVRFHLRA